MTDFNSAITLHQKGDHEGALKKYINLINSGEKHESLFMNAGSLARSGGNLKLSNKILSQGYKLYPNSSGIVNNYVNLLRETGEITLLIQISRKHLNFLPSDFKVRAALSETLVDLDLFELSLSIIINGFSYLKSKQEYQSYRGSFLSIYCKYLSKVKSTSFTPSKSFLSSLRHIVDDKTLAGDTPEDNLRFNMAVASLYLISGIPHLVPNAYETAYRCLQDVIANLSPDRSLKNKFIQQWHAFCWNLSIPLLQQGYFELGWQLYAHGTLVPAPGAQRWQRSFARFFTSDQVPVWNGRDLCNKTLLIYGEQGIGDTMMFLRLIPLFISRFTPVKVYIVPGDRLVPLFKNVFPSCEILNTDSARTLDKKTFDYQVPLGDIPRFLSDAFPANISSTNPLRFNPSPLNPSILPPSFYPQASQKRPVIGISWLGGGRADRLKLKSLDLKILLPLINLDGVDVVSLQYGKVKPILDSFNKTHSTNIIYPDVDPVKQFYEWTAVVQECDLILSVANTTIHAAGWLNKPTFCFLSRTYDWRWTKPDIYMDSYWYPCVKVGRQTQDGSWESAVIRAQEWLEKNLSLLKK